VLRERGLPLVVIELDSRRVDSSKNVGLPVIFGDATQPTVLAAASIRHARMVLVTIPGIIVAQTIVRRVREANPAVDIVARAADTDQMNTLREMGVFEVVLPEFEASLEMTRQALLHLAVPPAEVQMYSDKLRGEQYATLFRDWPDYRLISQLQNADRQFELMWIPVGPDSPLAGRTIGELAIRRRTGASVIGVLRDGTLLPNPDADFRFVAHDTVAVIGCGAEHQCFRDLTQSLGQPGAAAPIQSKNE